jgi:hypothetical protein
MNFSIGSASFFQLNDRTDSSQSLEAKHKTQNTGELILLIAFFSRSISMDTHLLRMADNDAID